MRIALVHYTTWPEIGGVENVIRDQASLLVRQGHKVVILTGLGSGEEDICPVITVPELSPTFPLFLAVKAVIDRGQSDQNFNKYRSAVVEALSVHFAEADVVIVHNILTVQYNLGLTQAMHDLATKFRIIAWTHDLAATNTDYALPNPTKMPWALMRTSAPGVTYVTLSEHRADEVKAHLKPAPPVRVIPHSIDWTRLFTLTPEMQESVPNLKLAEREFVFLLPARLILRKNIEFAIEAIRLLHARGRNALLLVTGSPDVYSNAAAQYGQFLKFSLPEEIKNHVVFVSDFFPVSDFVLRDLYNTADCLFFPSRREGFGLPVLEAALYRMPVWCQDIPAFHAVEGEGCFLLLSHDKLDDAVAWLESQPAFRLRRRVRREFSPERVYQEYYKPLLGPGA